MATTTADRLREIVTYDPDTGIFVWKPRDRSAFTSNGSYLRWHKNFCGKVAGCTIPKGYIQLRFDGQGFRGHRLAWLYCFGAFPSDEIDHINGNRSDNRLSNLRVATRTENNRNRARNARNKSGVQGVCWHIRDKCWTAFIRDGSKRISLGYFDTIQEAAAARSAAEQKYGYHPNHGRVPSHDWQERT